MAFSKDFVWGAAAASFQIEGTSAACPRGDSIWDAFCATDGKVFEGHHGRRACMHIQKWREDVRLMSELGLHAYRLSIAWPRVLPNGTGAVNQQGIAFYSDLIDALLAEGITPYVTLYHWDLPAALQAQGGWLNPKIVDWFAHYSRVVVEALSDRVRFWITINEPQCFVLLGHETGVHAPGSQLSEADVLKISHHALLAHGRSTRVIRERATLTPQIGIAPIGSVACPQTGSEDDTQAAKHATFENATDTLFSVAWWLDPVFRGAYPEAAYRQRYANMPQITDEQMRVIATPVDFCAFNFYQADVVKAGGDGLPEVVPCAPGSPRTTMGWSVSPEGIYWACRFLYERYQSPLYIAEAGLSCPDWISIDGAVHDPNRIDFLKRYLSFVERAVSESIPVHGFFQWSIMDNFEWAEGYKDRFGLIYVDFETGRRIPKDSYYWYQSLIACNGQTLPAWQDAGFNTNPRLPKVDPSQPSVVIVHGEPQANAR